jgi:hypothetical protein
MKRLLLLHLPGAGDHLLHGPMPYLAATAWRPLRIAFPPLPSVLQATLESGQPPAVHGVFGRRKLSGEEVEPRESWLAGLEGNLARTKSALTLAREDGLSRALDLGEAAAREHARVVDDQIRRLRDADEELSIVVIGGPSPRPCEARLDAGAFVPDGVAFQAEGAFLRIDTAMSRDQHSRAIMQVGVERVLQGEARERRGCDHPEAGRTILLAEAGWSFDEDRMAFGREEDGILGGPFVAVCGGSLEVAASTWPSRIHDLRIAPTMAEFLGQKISGHAEKAL